MSLVNYISKIKVDSGLIRITGKLKQFGPGGAILNADVNGEQKTTENLIGETVPKISTECLTNGIFKHRITNLPTGAYKNNSPAEDDGIKKKSKKDNKVASLESLQELFSSLVHNRVEFRGGAIMTDGTMNAEKSFRVDEAVPFENNKDYFTVENRRLGVKGDSGENDYPRQQILYKNLVFFVSCYLDLKSFNPNNNKLIKKFLEKVDMLEDNSKNNDFKSIVLRWLSESYPTSQSGDLDVEKITNKIVKEFSNYDHPVHRRFNSFLLMTEVNHEFLENREDLEKSLRLTKRHHGL